ncbi:MAG: NAD(P)-binding protein [Gemmatimonadaceae bacterium]
MQDANEGIDVPHDLTPAERELGMDRDITRRDFLNAAAIGAGASLLGAAAPNVRRDAIPSAPTTAPDAWHPWTGYAGVGDYARSNGNTWEIANAGHGIRDDLYARGIRQATPTGETYDLVIAGGGFAGVIAAYTFVKETKRQKPCLILENHPLIGGEAKRNEFIVRGQRLIGPQGANQCGYRGANAQSGWYADMWRDIAVPGPAPTIEFGKLPAGRKPMEVPRDNYMYYTKDVSENYGFFFDASQRWVTNMWGRRLEGTPYPDDVKRDMMRWREEPATPFNGDDDALGRWLDTMTYEEYLTKVRKLHPTVARYVDPFLASGAGLGADALSAYVPWYFRAFFPGFEGLSRTRNDFGLPPGHKLADAPGAMFPGGCDGTMRLLIKWLNPDVIEGSRSLADVHNGSIRFAAMDRADATCRMRAGATVVHVAHDPERRSEPAVVTYVKDGRFFSVRARTVIWAGGGWSGKHAVQNLPAEYRTAFDGLYRSPILVVNVALDNWRALYNLGYSVCSWDRGFGFTGNLREPMYVGDYRPPFDPDQPTLFTMYVPFPKTGLPVAEQGKVGRQEMFATSYRDYERQIRNQLVTLFGNAGFDPRRDIAGIILNRWGHAYINAGPGFFYGRDGKPAPSDVIRKPLGNVSFAHSELSGHQTHTDAGAEGMRAARQALAVLEGAG